jgi:hypothetical protein
MPRITPFSEGQVWREKDAKSPYVQKGWFWVIQEHDHRMKPNEKKVLMRYDPYGPNMHRGNENRHATDHIYTFTHAHIKKYAIPFDREVYLKAQEADTKVVALRDKLSEHGCRHNIVEHEKFFAQMKNLELECWKAWGEFQKLIMGEAAWHEMHKNDKWYQDTFLKAA